MKYSDPQLRGALLEEAILCLLRGSGYEVVMGKGSDKTLKDGNSGLEVMGRGTWHQIDAIADFMLTPPFSNTQRLLIEAKFYNRKIGLPIIRNAAGVLKDVSESWTKNGQGQTGNGIPKKRYHYLIAIFSNMKFTKPAQDYAFAQDIYLLPLGNSSYFQSIIEEIKRISATSLPSVLSLGSVRRYVRKRLNNESVASADGIMLGEVFDEFITVCNGQKFGFLTMFGGEFPAFLIASPDFNPDLVNGVTSVRIRRISGVWLIMDSTEKKLFSFDLPEAIFEQYSKRDRDQKATIANIKSTLMREFYAYRYFEGRFQILQFRLDMDWFDLIRENLNVRNI